MTKQKKPKFYVVWEGRQRGVFSDWDACKQSVHGFEGARYKSFESKAEAVAAFEKDASLFIGGAQKTVSPAAKSGKIFKPQVNWDSSICVDAACSGNPGDMEYRCVETRTGRELFRMGPFAEGTNNIGEFLGIVHALAMLKKQGDDATMIYSDSRTAIAWVRNRKPKTNLERTKRNSKVFELLDRATAWVETNQWKNRIEKWETEDWGEIPADFGRK